MLGVFLTSKLIPISISRSLTFLSLGERLKTPVSSSPLVQVR